VNPISRIAGIIGGSVLLALLGVILWQHVELSSARGELARIKAQAAQAVTTNTGQRAAAHEVKSDELHEIEIFRLRTVGPAVRLRAPADQLHPTPAACAGAGAPAAGLLDVHARDTGLRPAEESPDLRHLLELHAAKCDAVSAQLREQQSVR
jgi:hypothetical protein